MPSSPQQSGSTTKPPKVILGEDVSRPISSTQDSAIKTIFAFPPNRDTLGGTAYFILRDEGNILIDCPALDQTNQDFWQLCGGVDWLFITHRGAMGKTAEIQQVSGCKILIQEQEAYLLPGLTVTTFSQEFTLDSTLQAIWTPGHSPGSSCLYYSEFGGVLFSGRHLLPNLEGELVSLRTPKTFHWPRQIQSTQKLLKHFTPETLKYICPGGNIGFLRGKGFIDQAYSRMDTTIDKINSSPKS